MILGVTFRGWQEDSLGRGVAASAARWLNRSHCQCLSSVSRCSDALVLVKIVIESSCDDEDAAPGDEKASNSETSGL